MEGTPARRMGRPTLDEAAALQQQILDKALGLLRNGGSEGFSVDQLVIETGITKRTIYRRYKNKAGLINAVVSREVEHLISGVAEADTSEAPISRLHQWSWQLFEYIACEETIAFFNYLNFEALTNKEIRQYSVTWHNFMMDHACRLILDGQNGGLIRQGSPSRYALLLLDLIMGLFLRSKMSIGLNEALGGEEAKEYFAFRWAGFLSLAGEHPSK